MIRLVLYILVFYLAYQLLKSVGRSLLRPRQQSNDASQEDTDLIQDPHCGAYFLKQKGVKANVDGNSMYFCSPSCRDAYLLEHQSR
ncbi:MAG: hypothetical protein WCA08_02450 [Desulfoferrobacter sp.]